MTTTLVTGGNGFIGRYVVRALLEAGRNVLVLDRLGLTPEPGAELVLGDMRDANTVTDAMSHADSWIHLAGVLGTQETITNPRPAAEANILGGLNVLEAAAQYKLPGVNIAVGNHWETNTYSISKSTVERFCEMFRLYRGVNVSTVRALNAYGPGQSIAAPYGPSKVRKILPSFTCRALADDPIEIYGSGEQIMDCIHVEDVAHILVTALLHTETRGALPHVIEAGTGRPTTVNDIATEVIKTAGSGEIVYKPMRPGETPGAVVLADNSTLGALDINAEDLTTLEDGIAETVDWYRTHWLPEYQR